MKKFLDRIRMFRGKPVYEILAKTKESNDSFFVCYREDFEGNRKSRNLYFCTLGGYSAYGKPEKMDVCEMNHPPRCVWKICDPYDFDIIEKMYPNFKYIHKKYPNIYRHDLFSIAKHWIKNPKMELLLNMKLPNLAFNKTFFRYNEKKQRKIVDFYLHKCNGILYNLCDVEGAIKENTTPETFNEYRSKCRKLSIPFAKWVTLKAKEIPLFDYKRHMERLKDSFPEKAKDPYWTEFKNVADFHRKENKIIKEIKHIEELKDAEKAAALQTAYSLATKRYHWNGNFNGLEVYVPENTKDIENQAKKLNQCLIANNYIQRVIAKKCILVFIKDENGKPLATAELTGKKKAHVSQFYGNELDRDNCKPSQNCVVALDGFMDKFIRKSA